MKCTIIVGSSCDYFLIIVSLILDDNFERKTQNKQNKCQKRVAVMQPKNIAVIEYTN